jgi:hypothetical protein
VDPEKICKVRDWPAEELRRLGGLLQKIRAQLQLSLQASVSS